MTYPQSSRRVAILLALSLLSISCRREEGSVRPLLLFTQDGCNVYRFHDFGRFHYLATCTHTSTVSVVPDGESTAPVKIITKNSHILPSN